MTFCFSNYRGTNKSFYHYSGDKSKTRENADPLLNKTGKLVIQTEKAYTNVLMKQGLKRSFCALLHQIESIYLLVPPGQSERSLSCPPHLGKLLCRALAAVSLSSWHATLPLACHDLVCSGFSKLCFWLAVMLLGSGRAQECCSGVPEPGPPCVARSSFLPWTYPMSLLLPLIYWCLLIYTALCLSYLKYDK